MVRPEKSGSNLLCMDIGHERKTKIKSYAEEHHTTVTQIIIKQIDEMLAEQKNLEALRTGLPILNITTERQTTITEYDIKLFQEPHDRYTKLQNLTKTQQTKLAVDINFLRQQLQAARK